MSRDETIPSGLMWCNENKRTKQAPLNIVTPRRCGESQCVAGAGGTAGGVGGGAWSAAVVKGVIKGRRCSAAVTPVNLLPVRDRRLLGGGHTVNLS